MLDGENEKKLISRQEAKAQGLTQYFTGEPCKNGHVDTRRTDNSACSECQRERNRSSQKKRRQITSKYFESKPCLHCENTKRYKSDGSCVTCRKEGDKARRRGEQNRGIHKAITAAKQAAIAKGERTFHSGRDCPHGHENPPRLVTTSYCYLCDQANRTTKQQKAKVVKSKIKKPLTPRQQARKNKWTYYEGSECKKCGGTARFVSTANCKNCHNRSPAYRTSRITVEEHKDDNFEAILQRVYERDAKW